MKAIVVALILIALLGAIAAGALYRRAQHVPKSADNPLLELRRRLLNASAEDYGISANPTQVWALVMETTYDTGTASLILLADGSTSLYFSSGGGVIGAGEHADIKSLSKALVSRSSAFVAHFRPSNDFRFAAPGATRFLLRTNSATLTVDAPEAVLGTHQHPLAPLFHDAHQIIAAIRTHAS